MKLSELNDRLQKCLELYGDLEVVKMVHVYASRSLISEPIEKVCYVDNKTLDGQALSNVEPRITLV